MPRKERRNKNNLLNNKSRRYSADKLLTKRRLDFPSLSLSRARMGRNNNRNRKQQRRKSIAASKRAPVQEDNESEGEETAENALDKTLHFPATPKASESSRASHLEDDAEPALSDGGILTSALSWASFIASNVKQVIAEVRLMRLNIIRLLCSA